MGKSPDIIEETREQVIAYEQTTASAQAELEAFEAENGGKLEAIKAEFEDYGRHPLWQEHTQKASAVEQPAEKYVRWHSEKANDGDGLAGWRETVLFHGQPALYMGRLNAGDAERSVLPPSMAEFDRRLTIVSHLGQVAAMLRDHAGEPIVSIAGFNSSLVLATTTESKAKVDDNYSYYGYQDGSIDDLSKTRVIVGTIGEANGQPALGLGDSSDEKTAGNELRLALADSVTGIISAYDLPGDRAQLHQQITPPRVTKSRELRRDKRMDLPVGNIALSGMTLHEVAGRDLLVIDGTHRAAADYAFSDNVALYRPKQKVENQQTRDQEILMTTVNDTEQHSATVVSAEGRVTLPAPRHDTLWLIGNKAIEEGLEDGVFFATSLISRGRDTHQPVLRAARDLVEFANSGQSAVELAA